MFCYNEEMKMKHPICIYNFEVCYETGIGFEKDLIKAFELYKQVAILKERRTIYNLAVFYEIGEGVEIDFEKLMYIMRKQVN
jgi:TPR repeat protein